MKKMSAPLWCRCAEGPSKLGGRCARIAGGRAGCGLREAAFAVPYVSEVGGPTAEHFTLANPTGLRRAPSGWMYL